MPAIEFSDGLLALYVILTWLLVLFKKVEDLYLANYLTPLRLYVKEYVRRSMPRMPQEKGEDVQICSKYEKSKQKRRRSVLARDKGRVPTFSLDIDGV